MEDVIVLKHLAHFFFKEVHGYLLCDHLLSGRLGFIQGKGPVCSGGDVGELIGKSAHAPAGFSGVGIIEAVQEDIQSCFLILHGGFCREAGAAAFGGHEVTDVLIVAIGQYCFADCTALMSATIGCNVQEMGESLFSGCTVLTEVEINSSVGEASFKNCSTLEQVTFGESVIVIGAQGFYGCNAIQEVVLPEGIETIEERAFYNCSGLTKITLPKTLKSIGDEILYGTDSLDDIYYRGSSGDWSSINKAKKWSSGAGITYVTKHNAK